MIGKLSESPSCHRRAEQPPHLHGLQRGLLGTKEVVSNLLARDRCLGGWARVDVWAFERVIVGVCMGEGVWVSGRMRVWAGECGERKKTTSDRRKTRDRLVGSSNQSDGLF